MTAAEKTMRQGPDYIQFYPTLRCNRSCDFCFNRSLLPMQDMSADAFTLMLGRLREVGVRTIDVIGGEPTLHPVLGGMLRECREKGFRVNISSNGTNTGALETIMRSDNAVTLGISINDADTLHELAGFIDRFRPVLKSVYSRTSDPAFIRAVLARAPGRFFLIYRDATQDADLRETVPFPEFLAAAETFGHASAVGIVSCSGFLPDRENYPELEMVRCPAGTTKLGVMPDGSVYPCNLLFGRPAFLLGNILTEPFENIWHHRALDFFRSFSGNRCPRTDCSLHARCHGGCPAQSLLLAGDLAAPDPRCCSA